MNRDEKNVGLVGPLVAIAVMVVITVILAGVLYVWVIGLSATESDHYDTVGSTKYYDENQAPVQYYHPPTQNAGNNNDKNDQNNKEFTVDSDQSTSTFSMDVDTGSYTMARSYLEKGELPPTSSIRIEEFINYMDYSYRSDGDTFTLDIEGGRSGVENSNSHFLKIGIQAKKLLPEERKDAVITLVIDTSGSMESNNKLELVKKSIQVLLDNLTSYDKVGLVAFGDTAERIQEPTFDKSLVSSRVNGLSAMGRTNANEGLVKAYEMASENFIEGSINHVMLFSDGVANLDEITANGILGQVKENTGKFITLSTLGFGMGEYNDHLMEKLADHGDGNYAYIDSLTEARSLFSKGLTGLLNLVARDAKVNVDFHGELVEKYRLIGYENRLLDLEDFENDRIDAGEIGAGHTVTVLYELILKEGEGDLARIRIRYADVDTGYVEEKNLSVSTDQVIRPFEKTSPRFRFTIAVMEFAEALKDPHGLSRVILDSIHEQAEGAFEGLELLELDTEKDRGFLDMVERAMDITK